MFRTRAGVSSKIGMKMLHIALNEVSERGVIKK